MKTRGWLHRAIAVLGLTGASSGLAYIPACSLADIGENIIAGGLAFVEGYTEDVLLSLFPPPGSLVDGGE